MDFGDLSTSKFLEKEDEEKLTNVFGCHRLSRVNKKVKALEGPTRAS